MYKGNVLANIWLTDKVVKINPETGEFLEEYDFKGLRMKMQSMNGF